MKKILPLVLLTVFLSCNTNNNNEEKEKKSEPSVEEAKTYENERFKNVKVEKISSGSYRITGKAQVFEATLSYVVEDGHYELAKGFAMTDAGAPEFGNFDFTLNVEKKEPNSTLMLILFESSPKDGSRTHELFIPLEANE